MGFNPNDHLTKLKGKDYLEVKWRLVWFREEWPYGTIDTEVVELTDQRAVFRAAVCKVNEEGILRGRATGTKSETPKGFSDYIEKAETGAIGRALAALGFGTQFAPELEEGERIVDSPVERPIPVSAPEAPASQRALAALHAQAGTHGITHEQLHAWAEDKGYISMKEVPANLIQSLTNSLRNPEMAAKFDGQYPKPEAA